jgi:hypothetical protein
MYLKRGHVSITRRYHSDVMIKAEPSTVLEKLVCLNRSARIAFVRCRDFLCGLRLAADTSDRVGAP